jgi:hypothetical protein
MQNEPTPLPLAPSQSLPEPSPQRVQDPERGAFILGAFQRVVQLTLGALVQGLQDPTSTDSLSLSDRAFLGVLRAQLPRIQGVVSSRLSSLDPASLEVALAATAGSIDELLEAAPGTPLPRQLLRFDPASGELSLIPCPTCPDAGLG